VGDVPFAGGDVSLAEGGTADPALDCFEDAPFAGEDPADVALDDSALGGDPAEGATGAAFNFSTFFGSVAAGAVGEVVAALAFKGDVPSAGGIPVVEGAALLASEAMDVAPGAEGCLIDAAPNVAEEGLDTTSFCSAFGASRLSWSLLGVVSEGFGVSAASAPDAAGVSGFCVCVGAGSDIAELASLGAGVCSGGVALGVLVFAGEDFVSALGVAALVSLGSWACSVVCAAGAFVSALGAAALESLGSGACSVGCALEESAGEGDALDEPPAAGFAAPLCALEAGEGDALDEPPAEGFEAPPCEESAGEGDALDEPPEAGFAASLCALEAGEGDALDEPPAAGFAAPLCALEAGEGDALDEPPAAGFAAPPALEPPLARFETVATPGGFTVSCSPRSWRSRATGPVCTSWTALALNSFEFRLLDAGPASGAIDWKQERQEERP
jgi:hypothetical protein